jgi:hypothetical protein
MELSDQHQILASLTSILTEYEAWLVPEPVYNFFLGEDNFLPLLDLNTGPSHPWSSSNVIRKSIFFLFDYVSEKASGKRLVLLVNLLFQLVLNKQVIGLFSMLGNYIFAYLSRQTSIQCTLVFNMLH